MVATHSFTLRLPLPTHIPAEEAVAHLQAFDSLITPHPYLVKYERRPVTLNDLIDDPFFREDGMRLSAYVVTERIKLMPGVGKDIQIPAVFQSFHNGVRCRAEASGGVRVWSSYEVAPRKVAAFERADEASVNSSSAGDAEGYDLVERVTLTCSPLVKRFVVKAIEPAHKEICERMIVEMMERYKERHLPSQTAFGQALYC
jgi:hypothetical protein